MMNYKFGFIGIGNMGGIILDAVLKKTDPEEICVCDSNKEKINRVAGSGVTEVAAEYAANNSKYLFIGIKPQGFEGLFDAIKDYINPDTVIVSMAAGKDIWSIERLCEKDAKIIRIMPNTACSVGDGVILYTANESVTSKELEEVVDALSFAGLADEIEENKIDAAAALSGCGPAFVDLFIEALADGAVSCGLARDKALLYAAKTVEGAAKTVIVTGKSPAELKDMVCSPGGTTIQGVRALEKGKFRSATMEAVIAAYNKTKDLK
ncbi:MAG: pyrroline-5-carboxylate reductase [Acutalibacteraceae bacterium]|nr:pyrroline-5-carboxylate reductase [Acutalibacteraceae bacterium]